MSSIIKLIETFFSPNTNKNASENGTDIATSTYRTYFKSINVNAYKASSSPNEGSGGGNYYVAGVLFMLSVIGLLLYVNLYYEYCFRDTCFQLSKFRGCFFLRYFFVTVPVSSQSESKQNLTSALVNKKKDDIDNEHSIRLNIAENISKDEYIYKVYL